MLRTSRAVILRTWEFGESDLLVSFFSRDEGRLKGVAKGARRSRKRFVNCLDHFCLVDLEHEPRRTGDLNLIRTGKLVEGFPRIRRDFRTFSLAGYMVELTETLFPPGVAARAMFDLLVRSMESIERGGDPVLARIAFEAGAMALGGYAMDLDRCGRCRRPYRGVGPAVFDGGRGVIYCLKCASEPSGSPRLGAEAGSLLRALQSGEAGARPEGGIDAAVCGEIRKVMDLHMAFRLGRVMKTAAFLD